MVNPDLNRGVLTVGGLPPGNNPPFHQTSMRGQSFTIIPDPSLHVKARVLAGLEAGIEAVIQDPTTPEFATRLLQEIEPGLDSADPGYWFRRYFDLFVQDVRNILESACSLRENFPNADIPSTLRPNIEQFEWSSAHNLSIYVTGVLLAEQRFDMYAPNWRDRRDNSVFLSLKGSQAEECKDILKEPRPHRDSEILKHAKSLVVTMLPHLFRATGAQELLGEEEKLIVSKPVNVAPAKAAWVPSIDS